MTRNLWIGVLLIAIAGLAFASRGFFQKTPTAAKTPPSAICPKFVDLGDGILGDIATGQFRIRNGGDEDLIVHQFQSSCGCSGLEIKDGSNWVTPGEVLIQGGEELPCRIRLNVLDQASSGRSVRVGFQTNDPNNPTVTIDAQLNRICGMLIQPSAAILGQMLLGETKETQLELFDVGNTKMTFQKITFPDNPDLKIKLRSPENREEKINAPGRIAGVIDIRLKASKVGEFRHTAEFHFRTPEGKTIVSPLIIQGRIVEEISVTPSKISLPRHSSSGKTYQTYCLIKSADGKDFEVVCPTVTGVRSTLLPQVENSGIRTLEVEVLESNRSPRTIELPLTVRTERGDRKLSLTIDVGAGE